MCFVFTIGNEYSAFADFVVIKKDKNIFFMFNGDNNEWFNEKLSPTDNIVYFGGHFELVRLFNFGFNTAFNYYDLTHRVWNLNTTFTDLNLESCFYHCLDDVNDNNDKYCINDGTLKRANLFKKFKNIDEIKKLVLILSNSIERSSDNVIELNTNDKVFYFIDDILFMLEFMYEYTMKINSNIYANSLDDELNLSLSKLEMQPVKLDYNYLRTVRTKINDELENILKSIYCISKKKFNINSPRELNYILKDIGILNNKITNIELKNSYEQTGLSVFYYIDLYRKLNICLEQYIKPLYEASLKNKFGRFKYNTCKVPCLTRGHFCVERTKGIVDISEIEENDYIWTEYGFKRVIHCNSYLTSDLIRVEFSNGVTITGTKHHPILCNVANQERKTNHSIVCRWVSLDELFVGESVICNYNYRALKECDSAELKNVLYVKSAIICDIISKNAILENGYICLKNIRFSNSFSFLNFKTHCELMGLKFWSFCLNGNTEYYDVVFYDISGFVSLLKTHSSFLSNRTISLIEEFISNSSLLEFEKTNCNKQGYFNLDYEETVVLSVTNVSESDYVFDIEVEDVHQYNSNGLIHHNTGRLSSSRSSQKNNFYTNVNIQSVPKNNVNEINIRKSFLPEDECYWCCIDYKAQEMRLASCLYNITEIKNIPTSEDIYMSIGKKFDIFNRSNLSNETIRYALKVISLGMIYGLTNEGIKQQLRAINIEDKNNIDYRELFYNTYPQLLDGQSRTLNYAHAVNGIYTLSGRFRKIEFNYNDRIEFLTRNNRIALNTIIQGTCGDIIRILINNIEKEIKPFYSKYGFRLINTIHDEINISLPKDKILYREILNKLIPLIVTPIKQRSDITFGYSLSIGDNWGCLNKYS